MPKIVDHEARRGELAVALWRIVLREGIEAASVRRVAAEAGWSAGSLRHYFATHDEMLAFAMDAVAERIRTRIRAMLETITDPADTLRAVGLTLLPLDEERRAEVAVWFAFSIRAQVATGLRERRAAQDAELRGALREMLASMLGLGPDDARSQAEADRLVALIDGLCLHAVFDVDTMTPDRITAAFDAHLADITA